MVKSSLSGLVGLIGLAMVICTPSVSRAAPVTFRFEAEVASVALENGGSDLLPVVAVGDLLLARYTFESDGPALNHPQSTPFIFNLAGLTHESPAYSITVRNQSDNWIPLQGSLADPESVPIDDRGPGGQSDTLWIGSAAGSTGPFDTVLTGHTGGLNWHASILFAGSETLIDSSVVPLSPSTWNSMQFKEISISFIDAGTNKTTRVGAYISNVLLIPEPSSFILICCITTILVSSRANYRV